MEPRLSESEHRFYLEIFMSLVEDIKQLPKLKLLIQDNLNIARDVGYIKLADKYTQRFKEEGLLKEERVFADSTRLSREYLSLVIERSIQGSL